MQRIHTDDQAVESKIQAKGLTAPRITPADIEASIESCWYFTAAEGADGAATAGTPYAEQPPVPAQHPLRLLTFCVLVLKNGFTVTGESACASPENFDAEIGRNVARQNAVNKVWPLLGYVLKERLTAGQKPAPGAATPGYSTMQPHQQRVVDEHAELIDKLTKLGNFIGTPIYNGLADAEKERLNIQHGAMSNYAEVLGARITAFGK